MPTAKEVIEACLIESTKSGNCKDTAQSLIKHLSAAGYVIIKDRSDPEGGIPGRQR